MTRPRKSKKSVKSHGHRKPVDEGTIELEMSLKELPYVSEQISFGGMIWTIHLKRNMIAVDENKEEGSSKGDDTQEPAKKKKMVDYISVKLENMTKANQWSCKARGVFTLKKYKEKLAKDENEVSGHNTKFITVFHRCNQHRTFTKFAPFTAVSKNSSSYILNDKITVLLRWKVTSVTVDSFPSYDFSKPTPFSDVTLNVEGKKFYVNKSYLAMHSEYFDRLFNASFAEKDKDVIELKGFSSKMFHEFLLVIYPCRKAVQGCRVAELLAFADLYQVKILFALCEQFLLSKECKLSDGLKLKLADRYNLIKLRARLLRKLDDQKGLNKARDLQGLSAGTLQTIVRKVELVKTGVYKSENYGGLEFDSMDQQ